MKFYSTAELELIDELYDEQMDYADIAESCNELFHNKEKVRSVNSIGYAINKLIHDPRCLDLRMYSNE